MNAWILSAGAGYVGSSSTIAKTAYPRATPAGSWLLSPLHVIFLRGHQSFDLNATARIAPASAYFFASFDLLHCFLHRVRSYGRQGLISSLLRASNTRNGDGAKCANQFRNSSSSFGSLWRPSGNQIVRGDSTGSTLDEWERRGYIASVSFLSAGLSILAKVRLNLKSKSVRRSS